jgi:hypothetical protein
MSDFGSTKIILHLLPLVDHQPSSGMDERMTVFGQKQPLKLRE